MFEEYEIIYINGTSYYVQSSSIKYLKFINNKLVNISNSNITLVNNFDYQYNTYPRISCPSMSQCRLIQSQNSNYIGVTSDFERNKYNIGNYNLDSVIISLLFLITVFCLYRLVVKK